MIPELTLDQINNFVENGIPPGDFVNALLCNDLKKSFMYADDMNQVAMFKIVKYLYNKIPMGCWGSQEKVNAWIATKRQE